ncbi:hypothetical protein EOPP23_02990 [Endozoicomonas sp. OPT23]|uniref:SPOR domain-containing protein n=1 Tax=Endozoicomonas sp. OPT23 TaxID=2072845 RepID=UPI00129BE749|nr:SPOR domain-containing protein [Endozoicomonas sp. OPT23]MRI31963.1 hypothetical protein [Endozoicomonas sp. OPT23]
MSSRTPSNRGARKGASRKKTSTQRRLPAWLLLLTGFAAGFFVAFLIKLTPTPVDVVVDSSNKDASRQSSSEASPVFDFYTVLPESEVILPVEEPESQLRVQPAKPDKAKPQVAAAKPKPAKKQHKYLLQAGSFRSSQDAERLKARLLLAGQTPRVVKVTIGSGEAWHRVQLGPFETSESIDQARKVLAEHKIDGLLLRIK